MSFSKEEHERLKKILQEAYREKEKLPIDDQWQDDLMRRIRESHRVASTPIFLSTFEQVVWRLAPIICLLILALAAAVFSLDISSDYDPFQVLFNGREEFTLFQIFGV